MYLQNMNNSCILNKILTFGIPVRIDSKERKDNLQAIIRYLEVLKCRIIVLEADSTSQANDIFHIDSTEYHFIKDTQPTFHRTHYINQILQMAKTDVVAIWDTDVLVNYQHILEAVQLIKGGATLSYPYDGRFIMLSEQLSVQMRLNPDFEYLQNLRMKSFLGRKLCGGAYLVDRQKYIECGGENERFTGWGPEDAERLHRVAILGHKVQHIPNGELYHLYHPRGKNSDYQSKEDARQLREEFVKVCSMSSHELKTYLSK